MGNDNMEALIQQHILPRLAGMPDEFVEFVTGKDDSDQYWFALTDQMMIALVWERYTQLPGKVQDKLKALAQRISANMPEVVARLPENISVYFYEDESTTAKQALANNLPEVGVTLGEAEFNLDALAGEYLLGRLENIGKENPGGISAQAMDVEMQKVLAELETALEQVGDESTSPEMK